MIAPGKVGMQIVGLADKAVAESRERVQAALSCLGPVDAAQAHHRQSRAGRPAQGGQPLRSADRARPDGGARAPCPPTRSPATSCSANCRSTARSRAVAGALPAAIGANALRPRADLPRGLRARGGLGGRRHRHPRAAQPDRARQPFPRHPGAGASRGRHPRRRRATCPTSPTSRARRAPSGRSRSPPPAATIC